MIASGKNRVIFYLNSKEKAAQKEGNQCRFLRLSHKFSSFYKEVFWK